MKIQITAPPHRLPPRLLDMATEMDAIATTNEPTSVCERHSVAPRDGHHEDLVTVRSRQRNEKKRPRTHISYDETPTRPDIKSRLGPKRWCSIKERLVTPNIKSRLGQRENSWNQWDPTSPWQPWATGMEPKCNTEWNIQIRERMSNFFGAQEAENVPTDDEIVTVDSSNDNKDEKEN